MKTLTVNISDEQYNNPLIKQLINMLGGEIKEVEEPLDLVRPGWVPSAKIYSYFAMAMHLRNKRNHLNYSDFEFIADNPDTYIYDTIIDMNYFVETNQLGVDISDQTRKEIKALKVYARNNEKLDILIGPFVQFTRGYIFGIS